MQKCTYNSIFLCDITVYEYTLATLLGTRKQSNATQHSSTDICFIFTSFKRGVKSYMFITRVARQSGLSHGYTISQNPSFPGFKLSNHIGSE